MQKSAKSRCSFLTPVIFAALIFFSHFYQPVAATAQSRKKTIHIDNPSKKIRLNNYRITGIVDDRVKPGIGYITTYSTNKFLAAELEHPLTEELDAFIKENVNQSLGEEVSLHVIYFFLSEEMSAGEMAKIRFRLHFALFNKKNERLLDASVVDDKFTGPTRGAYAGKLIGECIETLLKDFDANLPKALARYQDPTPLPAWIVLNNAPEDKNLLPFSRKRQLNVSNFAGKEPPGSTALAGTSCGFIMNYELREMDGVLKAVIEIAPYFNQSAAWLKKGADLAQAGAYAQNQFDLAAVITCELVEAVDDKKFMFSTLKQDIESLRTEFELKIRQETAQQIAATDGGKKIPELEDWIEKTEFNLKGADCYE